ncbi:hypothetical protein PAMC26510_13145 [Caballeronia sordidicola]|jgi:hypothetical protein|uniref:Uncharacterized protein n=1 Tax=Caballeronia sordidicola TaxID=196367 RepID=A0A242MWM3_CABSO|nr:hypothetical protein PAMC26510_13145 [Caballeronia sordidicola]
MWGGGGALAARESQSARTPIKPICFGLSFFERKNNNRNE